MGVTGSRGQRTMANNWTWVLCCSDSPKMQPHPCQDPPKCTTFDGPDTHPVAFLKIPSSIAWVKPDMLKHLDVFSTQMKIHMQVQKNESNSLFLHVKNVCSTGEITYSLEWSATKAWMHLYYYAISQTLWSSELSSVSNTFCSEFS